MLFVHRLHCFSVCYLLALAVRSMGKSYFIIIRQIRGTLQGFSGVINI